MKTISFFSYKGGAGRSTLAFNVIPILANEYFKPTSLHPMIVVDTDVDSCGMSYLVKVDKKDITEENCVQYLLATGCDNRRYSSVKEHPFLSKLIPVGNAYGYAENDAILLLPAKDGKKIDGNENYSDKNNPFSSKLNNFLTACEELDIPAVIFDSAVGNNATANISNEASDVIVCCMRPTTQFTEGTLRFWMGVENMNDGEVGKTFSPKDIVLVPNVIPRGESVINGVKYPDMAYTKIRNNFVQRFDTDDVFHTYHFDMLDKQEFGIPVVDRFMWCEDILYTQESLNDDEKVVLDRYKKLAGVIYDI